MNKVEIKIEKNSPYYWYLKLDDGTSRHVFLLNHGEMKELAKLIPTEFLEAVKRDKECQHSNINRNNGTCMNCGMFSSAWTNDKTEYVINDVSREST